MNELAALQELEDRLPDGLEQGDHPRALAALADASALVREAGDSEWTADNVPEVVKTITLAVAKRGFLNPAEATSQAIDGLSISFGDVYLTRKEVAIIRRAAGRPSLWAQSTTRADDPAFGLDTKNVREADEFVDTDPLSEFFA